jgi:hypothetical protein
MEPHRAGQLVRLSTGGPVLDAIVFDTPSDQKVVVAVVDRKRGPVLRTVDPADLSERDDAGDQDAALQSLIRRQPLAARGGRAAAKGSVQGRRGHGRSATHRTTGK